MNCIPFEIMELLFHSVMFCEHILLSVLFVFVWVLVSLLIICTMFHNTISGWICWFSLPSGLFKFILLLHCLMFWKMKMYATFIMQPLSTRGLLVFLFIISNRTALKLFSCHFTVPPAVLLMKSRCSSILSIYLMLYH